MHLFHWQCMTNKSSMTVLVLFTSVSNKFLLAQLNSLLLKLFLHRLVYRMKIGYILFLSIASAAFANDLLVGKWKEDDSKRQNMDEFLKARGGWWLMANDLLIWPSMERAVLIIFVLAGVSSILLVIAKALPRFQLTMDIQKVGKNFVMTGTSKVYNSLIPNRFQLWACHKWHLMAGFGYTKFGP